MTPRRSCVKNKVHYMGSVYDNIRHVVLRYRIGGAVLRAANLQR